MKNLKGLTIFALVLITGFAARTGHAQASFAFGPRAGYEIDVVEAVFAGADARISVVGLPVALNPTFDYYFLDDADNTTLWQANVNGLYSFGVNNQTFTPYVGAGLAITKVSREAELVIGDLEADETEFGANLLIGAEFGFGSMRPFVQAQTVLGGDNYDTSSISAGILFYLGN